MNTVNHECYVSLEVAKLLKEAGFDWGVNTVYFMEYGGQFGCLDDTVVTHNTLTNSKITAPTLTVAQRWLREVKNIDVVVLRAMQWIQFYYTVEHEENRTSKVDFMSLNEDLWWFKYEEAQEAGIKNALELILEKK